MNDTLAHVPSHQPSAKHVGLPRVIVILLVGIVAIIATWFSPFGLQKRNLIAAEKHANVIRPLVQADARFQKVKIGTYTGNNGCLWVSGSVSSKVDGDALRTLVAATQPPVKTHFMIFLLHPEADPSSYLRLSDLPAGGS